MGRRFRHLGEDWEVSSSGMAHGGGSIHRSPATSFGVRFRCLSNLAKATYLGHIAIRDINAVAEEDLKRSLEQAEPEPAD